MPNWVNATSYDDIPADAAWAETYEFKGEEDDH